MHKLLVVLCTGYFLKCGFSNPVGYPSEVPKKGPPIVAKSFEEILTINEDRGDLFEGDIVISHQRNAIADPTIKWGSTVPYLLTGEYSHEKKATIIAALNELEVRTCFQFIERTTEVDYLIFEVKNGCFSNVGRSGGRQTVSIGNGCENHRTVIHEMLHALGFWHEQSRTDRDNYVSIVWDVISEGHESNFNKYESDKLDTQGVPYDYDSIMHYHDTAFSKNGSKTIIAPDDKTETMGKIDAMSKIDVEELNLLYQCKVDIDGSGYTQWSDWGICDQKCNKLRQRFCDGDQCSTWGAIETESMTCDESFCEVGKDPDCGLATVTGAAGSITSPLYPYPYKSNADCTQTIHTPTGTRIHLKFQDMDIEDYNGECHYDFLHVYDGPTDSSPKIGTYCGASMPSIIYTSSNSLTIKFTSDYSVVRNGFYANYYAVLYAESLHVCAFENDADLCGWSTDELVELAFRPLQGETTSSDTGPSSDHTFGYNQNGQYLYLESSSPAIFGQRARIISPTFYAIDHTKYCFSIWYNMYGVNTGSLSVYEVYDDVISSSSLVTMSGDKGDNQWYRLAVSISSTTPFKIAVEATRGNGYRGDIGIDDANLSTGECT